MEVEAVAVEVDMETGDQRDYLYLQPNHTRKSRNVPLHSHGRLKGTAVA